MTEADLQIQVADYLRLQYPDVMFHSDFGSGVKLTPGQAVKQKRQNGGRKAWPDMVIAQPQDVYIRLGSRSVFSTYKLKQRDPYWRIYSFAGLYIELKKEGERLLAVAGHRRMYHWLSKDGKEYKDKHTMEQADCLYDLRQRGYCAEFAIGFDEAKKIIDEYLGGK